jgi:hypothetical protein
MNFSTTTLVAEPTTTGSKYLALGINEGVSLMEFTAGESAKATPFLEATVSKGDDSNFSDKMYFSEKAQPSSLLRCIELLTAAGVDRAAIDTASSAAASMDDLASRFTKLIPARNSFRMKLNGEEDSKGSGKIYKRIPFQDFAEPTATSPSKLVYDEKYDIKRVPKPDGAVLAGAPAGANDLPF